MYITNLHRLPHRRKLWVLAATLALLAGGCGRSAPTAAAAGVASPKADRPVPQYTYTILNTYPHDRAAFTQGLIFLQGILLESTGLYGSSSLRKVELETGRVLASVPIPAEFFGEGMTVIGDRVFVLTWQNHRGFIYDLTTLAKTGEFSYTGEGWGLTTDGKYLILSDGTSEIRYLDPATFQVVRTIHVTRQGTPVTQLNELEYIKGEIYANVWQTDFIVRIDPASGELLGVVDFRGLLAPADRDRNTDVLNGIAYDASTDRLFVTGKRWPKLFQVQLIAR